MLNISNKILKIIALVIIVIGVGVGGFLSWRYYSSEIKNLENKISNSNQEITTLAGEKTTLTTNLETCNTELTTLKEKFGVALSDKEKAQAAASKSATEASKQKTAAQQANAAKTTAEQNLSSCAYYLDAAAQLADVLDTQKQYYKAASVNMANSGSALLDGNYDAALYYANLANDNSDAAASYEGRVNTLMGYFN